MQVSVETTGALERRIEVSVPRERIEQAIDERLKRVSRTAKLKGFRPGKVPFKVVKQQFGAQVRQEVLSDLMQSSFAEAVTQEKLNPAAGPRIEPISVGPEQDLKYRATFEVFPEIVLKGVEGIAVVRPAAEVTEADVDAMVLNLREQRPRFELVERESREGDRVTMDFEGQVDGAEFEGSKGADVAVLLGGGRMLKDFETGITGMKADERKQIDVPPIELPESDGPEIPTLGTFQFLGDNNGVWSLGEAGPGGVGFSINTGAVNTNNFSHIDLAPGSSKVHGSEIMAGVSVTYFQVYTGPTNWVKIFEDGTMFFQSGGGGGGVEATIL